MRVLLCIGGSLHLREIRDPGSSFFRYVACPSGAVERYDRELFLVPEDDGGFHACEVFLNHASPEAEDIEAILAEVIERDLIRREE